VKLEGKKILVADDEKRVAELLSIFLTSKGAEVITAIDGADAFRQATLHNPDLIMLDLNMPGTNGMEAIRSLRMTMSDKPILVLTGYCTAETFESALEAGATVCMGKPPKLAELTEVVERLLAGAADA
jgi:DNA-binding response OmpR family regulator